MPATNPGTTNLVAWWSLNETSGNRADSHGGNTLTDVNTVASASGKVGNAADFEAANSEYLSIADNTAVSMGDIDFTVCAWINLESKAANMRLVSKYNNAAAKREYLLYYLFSADRLAFVVSPNGGTFVTQITASNFGSPSTGAWLFVVASHSAASNLLSISVNNGTANTVAHTTGVFDSDSPFALGANPTSLNDYLDGLMDEVCIYKRVLTADEIEWLYNSGNGRAYSALTAAGLLPSMLQHAAMGWR